MTRPLLLSVRGPGLLCAITLMMPIMTLAQSSPASSAADETQEVLVTATRRAESILDVPMAISAVTGETLNERGLTQIESFAAQVPGFSVESAGSLGVRLVLRGQNAGGSGATVATMFDDVVLSSASALSRGSLVTPNLDTFDIERIEVLRGPQGTLYGATAQGGLLKYVARAPDLDEWGGRIELGLDNISDGDTGYSVKGVVNMPISPGVAAVRLTGYANDIAGYVDNPLLGLDDVNSGERNGGRVALAIQPSDALRIRLTAVLQSESIDSEGLTQLVGAPAAPNAETSASFRLFSGSPEENLQFAGRSDGDFRAYNAVLEYDFAPFTFISSTSFSEGERAFRVDASNSPAAPGLTLAAALSPLFGLPIVAIVDQSNNYEKFNQEFRLSSRAAGRITWQAGAFFSSEDVIFDQNFDTRSAANLAVPVTAFGLGLGGSLTDGSYEELSAFGDVTFDVTDRLALSVGARYTSIDQDAVFSTTPGLFTGPVAAVNPEIESSENKTTYSFAPRFKLNEDVSIYARIASGYRPGGPLTTPGAGTLFPDSFGPDSTVNYEIGTRGSLLDGRFSFDFAAYQIDWTDIQIITQYVNPATNQPFFITGNAGEAQSRGIEWSMAAKPIDSLEVALTGSFTDAELTTDALALGGSDGDSLPYVPKFNAALSIDYVAALANDVELRFGGTYTHVGKRFGDFSTFPAVSNNPEIPSYDTVDLRFGLQSGGYRIDLLARNIGDSRGVVTYRNTTGFNALSGAGVIVQPRTLALRFTADF
jgi:iron complex outermembrane recepter protein